MSGFLEWLAAQGDDGDPAAGANNLRNVTGADEKRPIGEFSPRGTSWQHLPVPDFPPWQQQAEVQGQDDDWDRNPDLWLYRERTVGLLRRYLRFSLETGRLPSMVGHEFFRSKLSAYPSATFEDRVILVRDVEKCIHRLEYWDQQLIARIILQEHNQGQAAHLLHCTRKTIQRRLPEVLDRLSEDFLKCGLLVAFPSPGEGGK